MCDFPGCDYTSPQGLTTRVLVQADISQHVEMGHILPIKAMEAEEKNLTAQAILVQAEVEKMRAKQEQSSTNAAALTTSQPPPSIQQKSACSTGIQTSLNNSGAGYIEDSNKLLNAIKPLALSTTTEPSDLTGT